jgi:phosphoenolpyruvate-protein kinase (PTS system EI component)
VKKIIRSVTYDECKSLVKRVLRRRTVASIEKSVKEFLKSRIPEHQVFRDEI